MNHLAELKRTQLVNVDRSAFMIEQLIMPGIASFLSIAGIIYLFVSRKVWKYRFLGIVVISVIITLMLLAGEELLYPGSISVSYCSRRSFVGIYAEKKMVKDICWLLLIITLTLPVIPIGIPV